MYVCMYVYYSASDCLHWRSFFLPFRTLSVNLLYILDSAGLWRRKTSQSVLRAGLCACARVWSPQRRIRVPATSSSLETR